MDRRPEPPLKPAFDPERLHTSFVPAFPGGNETPGVAPAITDTDLDRISRPDAYYDKAVKNVPMIHTHDAGRISTGIPRYWRRLSGLNTNSLAFLSHLKRHILLLRLPKRDQA